jgi:hypothetical protein
LRYEEVGARNGMAAGRHVAASAQVGRVGRDAGGRCSVCRRRKDKIHRNRKTGKLVCATCADRARMRLGPCADCGQRKLLQARGRCYACYKREWRWLKRATGKPSRQGGRRQVAS